jgi:hypothetical protein
LNSQLEFQRPPGGRHAPMFRHHHIDATRDKGRVPTRSRGNVLR